MTTPINASSLSAKSSQIQNADGTPIYNATTGEWTYKNASNVTTFNVSTAGACTLGPSSTSNIPNKINGSLTIQGYSTSNSLYAPNLSNDSFTALASGTPEYVLGPVRYGFIIVSNLTQGTSAMFMLSANTVTKISDPNSTFAITEANAGTVNVYYNGSALLCIKNRVGANHVLSVFSVDLTNVAVNKLS